MESSREPMQEADALPISVISYLSSALGTFLRSQAPASTPAVTSSTVTSSAGLSFLIPQRSTCLIGLVYGLEQLKCKHLQRCRI